MMSETGVITNESTVKSSEPKECADILQFLWGWPICNSLEFDRVHGELSSLETKSEVFNFVLLKTRISPA